MRNGATDEILRRYVVVSGPNRCRMRRSYRLVRRRRQCLPANHGWAVHYPPVFARSHRHGGCGLWRFRSELPVAIADACSSPAHQWNVRRWRIRHFVSWNRCASVCFDRDNEQRGHKSLDPLADRFAPGFAGDVLCRKRFGGKSDPRTQRQHVFKRHRQRSVRHARGRKCRWR